VQNFASTHFNKLCKISLGLAACGAALATAYAAITFNATTGVGFVGKGDVQLALGWNNAQLQNNASGLSFTYVQARSYSIECEWTTVTGGKTAKVIEHAVTHTFGADVNAAIAFAPRTQKQGGINGFNLNGFENAVVSGDPLPALGDRATCPGEQGTGAVGTVIAVSVGSTSGGLYVNHGETSVLLPTGL
jgi:hypothetical protein